MTLNQKEAYDHMQKALEKLLPMARKHGTLFGSINPWTEACDIGDAALTAVKKVQDELVQSVEPAAWMTQDGVACIPLYLHPPQPQATYSDSTPLLHVGNSSFEDWFQERDRAGKSDKQLAREAYAAGMGDPLVTYAAARGEKL